MDDFKSAVREVQTITQNIRAEAMEHQTILVDAAHAQSEMFVLIADVDGESTDQDHPAWIEAFGLAHDFTICINPWQGGGPCSNSLFSDVSFLKLTDLSTPALHERLVMGTQIPEVVIDVCIAPGGGPPLCYYRVRLTEVYVTNVGLAGSACTDPATCGGAQTESVSLSYRQIEWTFTPFVDGEPQSPVIRCWDTVAQNPC